MTDEQIIRNTLDETDIWDECDKATDRLLSTLSSREAEIMRLTEALVDIANEGRTEMDEDVIDYKAIAHRTTAIARTTLSASTEEFVPSGQDNAEDSLIAAMEWIGELLTMSHSVLHGTTQFIETPNDAYNDLVSAAETEPTLPAISKSIQKRVEAKGSQAQRGAEKDFAETFAAFREANDKRMAEFEAKGATT